MQVAKYIFTFVLLILACISSASERLKMGVTWTYTASGIFNTQIDELIVKEVLSNSPAEKAGLKVGDKVVSIEGCAIPGCPASKAKHYLKSQSLSQLKFVVETPNGLYKSLVVYLKKSMPNKKIKSD